MVGGKKMWEIDTGPDRIRDTEDRESDSVVFPNKN